VHATFAATGTPEIIYSTVSGCAPAALAGRRGWGHRRTSVLVRWDYKKPHRREVVGAIKKRYGTRDYAVLEVSLPDGQTKLYWDHQL